MAQRARIEHVVDSFEQQAALERDLQVGFEFADVALVEFDELGTVPAPRLVGLFRHIEFALVAINVHETVLLEQVARVGHVEQRIETIPGFRQQFTE